jgi:polysaccharide export outer membrane protein
VKTPEGKVPVIYRVNLKDPATFFVAQTFPMKNRDVLYAANASGAELQKFLNLVMTSVYPALTLMNTARGF